MRSICGGRLHHGLTAGLLFFLIPVAGAVPAVDSPRPSFREWQVIEVKAGQTIGFDQWMHILLDQDVIYLGEEHHNRWHIEAALKILQGLLAQSRRPVLALEMFGWDGQAGLTRYLSEPDMPREQFLQASRWDENWGGAFDDYAPLVHYAREHHLPVLALNPPRSLVRRVASQGLAMALTDEEIARWGMKREYLEDSSYRQVIERQLRLCHGGLADEAYERMYEASLFRDEGMAKTITDHLSRAADLGTGLGAAPIISYTGGGHIQYRLPVPSRVQRRANRPLKQTTVYLAALDPASPEEVTTLLQEAIADYVWLTPIGTHGPPKRCR